MADFSRLPLGVFRGAVQGREAPEGGVPPEHEVVSLESIDGEIFYVPRSVAWHCTRIHAALRVVLPNETIVLPCMSRCMQLEGKRN